MNIKTIGTMFVLFSLISGVSMTQAYGDHSMASVSIPAGTSIQGCEATNECFIPSDVTVDKGGEVIWTNDDTAAHTVTSGSAANIDGLFDSSYNKSLQALYPCGTIKFCVRQSGHRYMALLMYNNDV